MTNGDYFRSCNDKELAELLTTLCVGIATQLGIEATQEEVECETASFLEYLKQEMLKGEYLN